VRKGKLLFPICTLGSQQNPRSVNRVIDPTLTIVDWSSRSNFADLLPDEIAGLAPKLAGPSESDGMPEERTDADRATAEAIDDEIPF
jgi:hypothetical protein